MYFFVVVLKFVFFLKGINTRIVKFVWMRVTFEAKGK